MIIVLGTAFLLLAVEDWLDGTVAVSGLLAVMSMAMVLAMRSVPEVTVRLQEKFGKLWLGTELNNKERLYCTIAYLPKATVQAAIGSVSLALGLPCGKIVLSVAVMSILITAPLGAIGMDQNYKNCW
ncbi:MAG: hypothetical protein SOY73_08895 [Blautia sp.]|nr:hypothetical protein [Blautia sp.]